jgi:hypothetical protein
MTVFTHCGCLLEFNKCHRALIAHMGAKSAKQVILSLMYLVFKEQRIILNAYELRGESGGPGLV